MIDVNIRRGDVRRDRYLLADSIRARPFDAGIVRPAWLRVLGRVGDAFRPVALPALLVLYVAGAGIAASSGLRIAAAVPATLNDSHARVGNHGHTVLRHR